MIKAVRKCFPKDNRFEFTVTLEGKFMRKKIILGWLLIFISTNTFAEIVKVAVEPFPPLIVDDKSGYTIELLRKVEAISDIEFKITVVPWVRAKRMLKTGVYDMIAHSAPQAEGEDFYTYAEELNWKKEVCSDIYSMKQGNIDNFKNILVGVPRGGEDAAHELAGIPFKNIWSGDLENLFKMLEKGRIDAFWYERGSSMSTIKQLKLNGIFYKKLPEESLFAGIAVQKNEKGLALKEKLDKLIEAVDHDSIFREYDTFLKMPNTGVLKNE